MKMGVDDEMTTRVKAAVHHSLVCNTEQNALEPIIPRAVFTKSILNVRLCYVRFHSYLGHIERGYRRKNFVDAVNVTVNSILASKPMAVTQQM
jgi:hypothetical protein